MGQSNKFKHYWVKFEISSLMLKKNIEKETSTSFTGSLCFVYDFICHFLQKSEDFWNSIVYFSTVMTTVMMMAAVMMVMVAVQVQAISVSHPRLYTDCTLSGYFGSL